MVHGYGMLNASVWANQRIFIHLVLTMILKNQIWTKRILRQWHLLIKIMKPTTF